MKKISMIIVILTFLQFPKIEAQNQSFYSGISLGMGITVTHLDENIGNAEYWGFNLPLPMEAFIGYRFNSSLSIQAVGGYHPKNYQVTPDNFFQSGNVPKFNGSIGGIDGNSHIGLNLLLRRPIGKTSTKYIGTLLGYSKTWYPYASSSSTSTCNSLDRTLPDGCLTGFNMHYDADQRNNHFLVLGIFFEKTVGKKANRMLRLGLNYRKGGGDAPPIVGELYYLEDGARVETVNFYSNGSMLSLDVGYMFNFGKS